MKKIMILIAAMAMTALTSQAENIEVVDTTVAAMDAPAPTDADTNGTKEEGK